MTSRGVADEQPLLLHRAIDQIVYVILVVAELANAAWGADVPHELDDDVRQRVLVGVLDGSPVRSSATRWCRSGAAS